METTNAIYQRPRGANKGYDFSEKAPAVTSNAYEQNNVVIETACLTPRRNEYGKDVRKQLEAHQIQERRANVRDLEPRTDGKTNTVTTVQKDNLIIQLNPSTESQGTQPYQQNRVYDPNGIAPALCEGVGGRSIKVAEKTDTRTRIRRLTPTECARLQTIPDWYKWVTSETQQYRMLGNGWTVEVIKHILSFIPEELKQRQA